MKQTIREVLDDMADGQINLASSKARETIANLISAALKIKGCYTEYGDDEIEILDEINKKKWNLEQK